MDCNATGVHIFFGKTVLLFYIKTKFSITTKIFYRKNVSTPFTWLSIEIELVG